MCDAALSSAQRAAKEALGELRRVAFDRRAIDTGPIIANVGNAARPAFRQVPGNTK